jgi:hypothetical protein
MQRLGHVAIIAGAVVALVIGGAIAENRASAPELVAEHLEVERQYPELLEATCNASRRRG